MTTFDRAQRAYDAQEPPGYWFVPCRVCGEVECECEDEYDD